MIKDYTTTITAEKSISEISAALSKFGAKRIITDYEDGIPTEVQFMLPIADRMIFTDFQQSPPVFLNQWSVTAHKRSS